MALFLPRHQVRPYCSAPPEKVLRREINSIRELQDAEPDSKCWSIRSSTGVLLIATGCMNALANYLILQSGMSADRFKSTRIREEAKSLFGRLEEIDPDRRERYKDMAAEC